MTRITAHGTARRRLPGSAVSVPDSEWVDEELAVELEVDEELAFESDDHPLRLIGEEADDRFASACRDEGQYAAEELAMHLLD